MGRASSPFQPPTHSLSIPTNLSGETLRRQLLLRDATDNVKIKRVQKDKVFQPSASTRAKERIIPRGSRYSRLFNKLVKPLQAGNRGRTVLSSGCRPQESSAGLATLKAPIPPHHSLINDCWSAAEGMENWRCERRRSCRMEKTEDEEKTTAEMGSEEDSTIGV